MKFKVGDLVFSRYSELWPIGIVVSYRRSDPWDPRPTYYQVYWGHKGYAPSYENGLRAVDQEVEFL